MSTSLHDFHKAFADCLGPPWELVRKVASYTKLSKEPSKEELSAAGNVYNALDFQRLHEQMITVGRAAVSITRSFKGTAQDRTRPLRYLTRSLWSCWLILGFPEPRLIRGANSHDPDAPDEDALAETVRLVVDLLRHPKSKPSEEEVTYMLRKVIEEGQEKLIADG